MNRPTRRRFVRVPHSHGESLDRRLLLSVSITELPNDPGRYLVQFDEAGSNTSDVLVLGVEDGALAYTWNGVPSRDLDTTTPGVQSLLVTQVAGIEVHVGNGSDLVDAGSIEIPTTLSGGNGNDTLIGGAGNDLILGGEGSESLIGGAGDDTILGGSSASVLIGGDGDDCLVGGNGQDSLYGNAGDDTLFGGSSRDRLDGGPGDDRLSGGPGNDELIGGDGFDRVVEVIGKDATLTESTLSSQSLGSDTLQQIEGAELTGTTGDNRLDASAFQGDTTLNGAGGNDVLIGGRGRNEFLKLPGDLGTVEMFGGPNENIYRLSPYGQTTIHADGLDSVSFEFSDAGLNVDTTINDGTPQTPIAGGTLILFGVVEGLQGSDSDDILSGGGKLDGGNGNDLLVSFGGDFGGNSTLDGGDGHDTLQGGSGNDSLAGGNGNDLLVSFGGDFGGNTTLDGGDGNDTLQGGSGNDSLAGGNGNDLLVSFGGDFGGNTTLNGGDGHDTLRGGSGNDSLAGGNGNDLLVSFGGDFGGNSTLDGGDGNDTLRGGSGNDSLAGGNGNDLLVSFGGDFGGNTTLNGGDGNDTLRGGSGNDSLAGGNGNDLLVSFGGDFGGTSTLDGGDGNDTLRGGPGNEFLFGGDGDDLLFGGAGDDTFLGGMGGDIIFGDEGNDSIDGGDGDDLLIGGTGEVVRDGDDPSSFGSDDDHDTLIGGGGDDVLMGGRGDDRLDGGDGGDVYRFVGLMLGSDLLVDLGGDGDTLDFSAFGGPATIDLASYLPQIVNPGLLTLTIGASTEIEDVIGSRYADVISGNSRANRISGADYFAAREREDMPSPGWDGLVQVVLLDFDSETEPGEHVYTTDDAVWGPGGERRAIQESLERLYAAFHVVFTASAAEAISLSGGLYATLFFNKAPDTDDPGAIGQADEFDFRNVNLGGTAAINVNGILGGTGAFEATTENIVAASAYVAGHELGHLMGLRHADAFGPIGLGIHDPPGPGDPEPDYPGPSSAYETNFHVMSTGSFSGLSFQEALKGLFFGEREALKIAFSESGAVLPEMARPPGSGLVQNLDTAALAVPNTLRRGANALKDFSVGAITVLGAIELDPSSGRSETDAYTFWGQAGDIFNFEVFSSSLASDDPQYPGRIANPIDSTLSLYGPLGEPLAFNDDGFEGSRDSILIDVRLEETGYFTLHVGTFSDLDVGAYELLVYRFEAGNAFPATDAGTPGDVLRGFEGDDSLLAGPGDDLLDGGLGSDVLDGGPGNDIYLVAPGGIDPVSGLPVPANDVIRDAGGRDRIDFSQAGTGVTFRADRIAGQSQTVDALGNTVSVLGAMEWVIGSAFNDHFVASDRSSPLTLSGGSGDDTLIAGSGADILLGGPGADALHGGGGRDLLIGGAGADILQGGDGDDILIGGTTVFDDNLAALDAILAEWTSDRTYSQRIDRLTGKKPGGLNGPYLLILGTTVLDDGAVDILTGGLGDDLFAIFPPKDTATDRNKEKKL